MEQVTLTQCIVGWRGYAFARPHFLTHTMSVLVPRQRSEAFCANHDDHVAPSETCTCGFYSFKTRDDLAEEGYGAQNFIAEVYFWGKVIEHRIGYRAQYCYPKKLYACMASSTPYLAYVADVYGVPYDDTTEGQFLKPVRPVSPKDVPLTFNDLWNIAFNDKVDTSTRRFVRNQVRQRVWMKLRSRTSRRDALLKEYNRVKAEVPQLQLQLEALDSLKNELDRI